MALTTKMKQEYLDRFGDLPIMGYPPEESERLVLKALRTQRRIPDQLTVLKRQGVDTEGVLV